MKYGKGENVNIILIDDHEVIRDGIKGLIEQEFGWQVIYSASQLPNYNSNELFDNTDVAILDISLKIESGFSILQKVKSSYPHIKCVMLSMYEHIGYVSKALELGADSYVTKTAATKELLAALDAVYSNKNYLSSDISNSLAFSKNDSFNGLTEREREVFLHLARGLIPKKISQILNTMPKTIMVHRTNIYNKLGVSTQFELLRLALAEGILDVDDILNVSQN